MASKSGKQSGDGQAMLENLKSVIEREFTPEQLAELRKRLEQSEERAKRLQETPLENVDEPEIVFQPYRKDEMGS
jgi:hypothetical protein